MHLANAPGAGKRFASDAALGRISMGTAVMSSVLAEMRIVGETA